MIFKWGVAIILFYVITNDPEIELIDPAKERAPDCEFFLFDENPHAYDWCKGTHYINGIEKEERYT